MIFLISIIHIFSMHVALFKGIQILCTTFFVPSIATLSCVYFFFHFIRQVKQIYGKSWLMEHKVKHKKWYRKCVFHLEGVINFHLRVYSASLSWSAHFSGLKKKSYSKSLNFVQFLYDSFRHDANKLKKKILFFIRLF